MPTVHCGLPRAEARAQIRPMAPQTIFASDMHPGAIAATRRHLEQVGLSDAVTLDQADFIGRGAPASSGLLVSNPPYGVRLSEQEELQAEYPEWGRTLKQQFSGWTAALFTADLELPKGIGLETTSPLPVKERCAGMPVVRD